MLCDLDILNRFDILHENNDSMDFLCIRVDKYILDVPYLYYRNLEHIVHLYHMDLDYIDQPL